MPSLDIIFIGSGGFGSPTLSALVSAGHRVVQILTQPDKPAGRGKKLTPTPIALLAEQLGQSAIRTDNINALSLPPADVMVVIAFGQKIAPLAVNHARLGAVNLHASLLPKYRGAAPIHWAIINGDEVTGNSIIRLADKMDAGAVLAQSQMPIGPTDTTADLHDRLANDGSALMLRTLNQLADGTAIETAQDPANVTIAPKLSRESAVLDFTMPAAMVARRINGLSPWPGCRVRTIYADGSAGGSLTLLRARAVAGHTSLAPGILDEQGNIATGDGSIALFEVQPDNKRRMPFDDFRRGNRWDAGTTLSGIK